MCVCAPANTLLEVDFILREVTKEVRSLQTRLSPDNEDYRERTEQNNATITNFPETDEEIIRASLETRQLDPLQAPASSLFGFFFFFFFPVAGARTRKRRYEMLEDIFSPEI